MSGYLYYDECNKDLFSPKGKYMIPLTNRNYACTSRSRAQASNINMIFCKQILPVKNPESFTQSPDHLFNSHY